MKKLKLILIIIIVSIGGYKILLQQDNFKNNFSWIFESEDQDILPELSNEEIEKNRLKNQESQAKKKKIKKEITKKPETPVTEKKVKNLDNESNKNESIEDIRKSIQEQINNLNKQN